LNSKSAVEVSQLMSRADCVSHVMLLDCMKPVAST